MTPEEFPYWSYSSDNINQTGVVTTIHLTDLGIPGARDWRTFRRGKLAFPCRRLLRATPTLVFDLWAACCFLLLFMGSSCSRPLSRRRGHRRATPQ